VPSIEEFRERIQKITKKYPYLVATINSEIVGYAYATAYKERAAYDWSVETTVYVKQDEHGNGIGKALYIELEQALKNKHIVNMLACITYPNPKSIDFHTKFGFSTVGHFPKIGFKFNEWRDIVWMMKTLS
ncbi:MAG TPA: GNAT family N-acetyltransferase, partial [Erysipelotrichaceae bacterium]|nr:GNAT family N-acetyltransferase [Erysipelotrichaceae bacterium]